MALVEGGAFHCYIHDFETPSIEEWNNHCFGDDQHTEQGTTVCISCGVVIEFTDLPFHKLGPDGSKGIALKCEACDTKTTGKVKRSVVVKK